MPKSAQYKVEMMQDHIINFLNDCELKLFECPEQLRRGQRQKLNRIQDAFDKTSNVDNLNVKMKELVIIGNDLSDYYKSLRQDIPVSSRRQRK